MHKVNVTGFANAVQRTLSQAVMPYRILGRLNADQIVSPKMSPSRCPYCYNIRANIRDGGFVISKIPIAREKKAPAIRKSLSDRVSSRFLADILPNHRFIDRVELLLFALLNAIRREDPWQATLLH